MTVLSAQSIRKLCEDEELAIPGFGFFIIPNTIPMITPFDEKRVFEGKSYGLTAAGYDIRIKQDITMMPGDFLLASSVEYFRIPKNVRGTLWNKSSWAREGLDQSQTILEPGWEGHLTLELKNINSAFFWTKEKELMFKSWPYFEAHPNEIFNIKAGSPIAQITFEWLDQETDRPYTGKYQNQANEPVGAIYEKD